MSDVYNSIMAGLTEAIEDAKATEKKLQRRVVSVVPVKEYSSSEVKQIREKTKLTALVCKLYGRIRQNGRSLGSWNQSS